MTEAAVLPTLAVVPFACHSECNIQLDVIGEILANNVIDLLSQSLHVRVISRLSATKYRKANWSFNEIKKSLGCDYVLHGSYSEQQHGLSIEFQLSIASTGVSIWEDVITCGIREILDSNSYLVKYLANCTAQKIFESGIPGSNAESLGSLETYALYINAINNMHANDSERFSQSKASFQQILKRHPYNSDILAFMAQWHILRLHREGGWKNRASNAVIHSIRRYVDDALDFNPCSDYAIAIKAVVETQFFKDVNLGVDLISRQLGAAQNDPRVQSLKALVYSSAKRHLEATTSIDKAIELSPLDPQLEFFYAIAAAAHYLSERFALAEQYAHRSIQLNSVHTSPWRTLVATQVAIGEMGQAKLTAQHLLKLEPEFTVESWLNHWSGDKQDGQQSAARLSAAGIPMR